MRKTILIVEISLLLSVLGATSAQTAPNVNQTATRSSCSNIVALSGAKIDCSKLTPAQKQAIENIPAILKMAVENNDYLNAILTKLNTMSQPTANNSAPGGFAVSGGTLINPQVTNIDTSALPVLSQGQLDHMQTRLSMIKAKVLIRFDGNDRDANILGNDLCKTLKAAGWDADFQAGMGGTGIQIPLPILMGVSTDFPEADQLLVAIREATGLQVPGILEADIPKNEIVILLTSKPFRRPQ
jgi:hypothetical protein